MARDAEEFWRALERWWPGATEVRERQIARSVLALLRYRIRPEEAQQIESDLPDELGRFWTIPAATRPDHSSGRPRLELTHNKFLERVQQLARLSDVGQAAWATAAVFGAMREVISSAAAERLEQQLPLGLKELWCVEGVLATSPDVVASDRGRPGSPPSFVGTVDTVTDAAISHEESLYEPSRTSLFWASVDERLEGVVAATAGEVAGTVLSHLRAWLSPALSARVRAALPPDLRSYWAGNVPMRERGDVPSGFLRRVACDLELTAEPAAARHATVVSLGALRRMLPTDLADAVAMELPVDVRSLWDGAPEGQRDMASSA